MSEPVGPTVAELGEFPMIARAVLGRTQPATTLVGPGHDAALVAAADGRVAISTDMLVEGRHFRLDWSTPQQIGRKAVAQNGADVAALGARPTAFVVALGCPPDTPASILEGISAGIGEAAETLGAGVVGGDLVQAGQIIVSVTVLGDLEGRPPLLRSGARPGDIVAVAGTLGHSAAGLAMLLAGREDFADLVAAHRVPEPPYAAALDAGRGGARACTDISDGLLADARHIADASHVGIDLHAASLEPDVRLRAAGAALGTDPSEWVLTGGEDHGLLACFPPDTPLPASWRPVGAVTVGSDVTVDGRTRHGDGGWLSFARPDSR